MSVAHKNYTEHKTASPQYIYLRVDFSSNFNDVQIALREF